MRALAQTFTTHNTTHNAHTKLAHRREFPHARAHPDKHHTQQNTQCTHKNLHTAGSFRMRARTQTNTTRIKTHNAHTKTCTPQGVSACARARRHARDTQCTRENLHTAQQMCMRTLAKAFNAHKKKTQKGRRAALESGRSADDAAPAAGKRRAPARLRAA